MKRHVSAVRSLEGILLLTLVWIGVGWVLVNRTAIPNEAFAVGSVLLIGVVLLLTRRVLANYSE